MRIILAYTLAEAARGETVAKACVERVGEPSQSTRQASVVVTIVVVVIICLCCWEWAPYCWKDLRLEITNSTLSKFFITNSEFGSKTSTDICGLSEDSWITKWTSRILEIQARKLKKVLEDIPDSCGFVQIVGYLGDRVMHPNRYISRWQSSRTLHRVVW
jgi:hypothetical protein